MYSSGTGSAGSVGPVGSVGSVGSRRCSKAATGALRRRRPRPACLARGKRKANLSFVNATGWQVSDKVIISWLLRFKVQISCLYSVESVRDPSYSLHNMYQYDVMYLYIIRGGNPQRSKATLAKESNPIWSWQKQTEKKYVVGQTQSQ